jgi:hypothetical protein
MNTELMKSIYDSFAKKAVEIFNQEGHAESQLFVIFDSDSERRAFFAFPPAFASEILNTESGKDRLKPLLHRVLSDENFHRHLSDQGFQKPQMVVQISEAWVSKNLKSRNVNGFKPSEDPNRTEAILIALHTPDRSLIGMCPIVDEPTRHAEYGELELDGRNFGRMSLTTEEVLQ